MPAARKLHPEISSDARVASLSHLEHRVFSQYIVSADDFGVMPATAAFLRGENPALHKEPERKVDAALRQVIAVELLATFQHDGFRYVWSLKWQDHQDIRWPRKSSRPIPCDLSIASPATRDLFLRHHKRSPKDHGDLLADHAEKSLTRAHGAHGPQPKSQPEPKPQPQPDGVITFEAFWSAYPRKVAKAAAEVEWRRQVGRGADPADIVAGLTRAKATRLWQLNMREPEMPHIPHGRAWLYGQRWKDELARHAPVDARPAVADDVRDLCERAGLKRYDIDEWFVGAVITGDGDTVTIIVADDLSRRWIADHYSVDLGAAVIRAGAKNFEIAAPAVEIA